MIHAESLGTFPSAVHWKHTNYSAINPDLIVINLSRAISRNASWEQSVTLQCTDPKIEHSLKFLSLGTIKRAVDFIRRIPAVCRFYTLVCVYKMKNHECHGYIKYIIQAEDTRHNFKPTGFLLSIVTIACTLPTGHRLHNLQ